MQTMRAAMGCCAVHHYFIVNRWLWFPLVCTSHSPAVVCVWFPLRDASVFGILLAATARECNQPGNGNCSAAVMPARHYCWPTELEPLSCQVLNDALWKLFLGKVIYAPGTAGWTKRSETAIKEKIWGSRRALLSSVLDARVLCIERKSGAMARGSGERRIINMHNGRFFAHANMNEA